MNRYFSLIPLVILITTACDRKAPEITPLPRMVKVAEVVAIGDAQQRVFPARIESGDSTDLSFKRGGQIESLDVRQGAAITQGQTLARLSAREAQQRVNERQTAATLAQRQFDRFQTLAGRQAISKAEMDIQRANRDAANAALKIAREELSQMTLTAPFSGVAAYVPVRNHQVVAAGQPIVTLTRTDLLDVVFSVPENLFTALDIRNAQYRPVVKINAMPDRQFTADYKEHTGSSDSSTLTWQIILTMPRPADFPAVGGVSGTVTINLANLPASAGQNAVVVPVEAVFNPDNRPRNEPHVWVVQGSGDQLKLEERKVGVGPVTSQGVVITEGLSVGERVVAAGVSELHAQQPVRIWTRERGL
ncbi:efflux RND transporter periplasmic adaptor subunit [Klebsiella michiganensis]|uniref:Efflux transporter, RND family, MFP subunit n=1 Tax=Klebsiella michiganensis (strain ATCC 8724 / DSM 4798 / JCM 20051 / NBRC 3318 / NRRL B-199 / KCTC 1686 / BUCSAV 143 / CCM 1901) TaxID=1006551 RepID=A0A0H3HIY0_KLEM8|nr:MULTISPECIES: efflux RND transporter periplasmic adaptor subunit [Klebsiella]AEX06571.1 efflux transporter, RND family, MFP subunit [Klebsiella michiganensis KCTC 1686]AHW88153.1 RND family efflux transporter MFP subunit [Klebsiella michiganensis HKOPL1]MBG2548724.1 efflux RND transporter periplasmic adaptor subunit [Klebsiella michiganensis]MBZ7189508.1 efflux RND transporter periplasmic adaptor subunit [Klebsiella michiganensis]MBZ7232620.1 efflux RND transporter periplasmic adaptor subun